MSENVSQRKDEHLQIATDQYRQRTNSFDGVDVLHVGVPNLRVADVSIATSWQGIELSSPIYINAMTGGSQKTAEINRQLGEVASQTGIMMATGSLMSAITHPELESSFKVARETNPQGVLLANVGARASVEQARKAVEILGAQALQIHINAPQELVMPEGERDFRLWRDNIAAIVAGINVPVVVKEVGFGMSRETIATLASLGVKTVDIAGAGGTSFSAIENQRREYQEYAYLDSFGIPAVCSLMEAWQVDSVRNGSVELLASGGVRNAYDVLKALCLGARAVGISGAVLHCLLEYGVDGTVAWIERMKQELTHLYAMVGARNTSALREVPLVWHGQTLDWAASRGIDVETLAKQRI